MNSDAELIKRIVDEADESAFRLLYRAHTPRIYQLLFRLAGRDTASAEELVQDTWLRAVRLLSTFRPDAELSSWLRGVAVNVAREWLRRHRRELERSSEIDPDACAARSVHLDAVIDLDDAIAALPAGCRAVLVLHDVEGFTHEEIAAQLGLAIGTSKSQLFDARRALRRVLGDRSTPKERMHGSP
ncbi:MAG TPA: sigma-70 family RNA polymerase sigma factor [Gemmatimonadaceae bacterium]